MQKKSFHVIFQYPYLKVKFDSQKTDQVNKKAELGLGMKGIRTDGRGRRVEFYTFFGGNWNVILLFWGPWRRGWCGVMGK